MHIHHRTWLVIGATGFQLTAGAAENVDISLLEVDVFASPDTGMNTG